MNNVISFLVTVVSCLIVCGLVVAFIHTVLGQWSTLVWVGVGLVVLYGIAQRINA